MMNLNQQNPMNPDDFVEMIFRYKWIIILTLASSLTIGLFKSFTATRIYESTTMILVQPQKVPQSFVRSVVSTGIEARISTISQQIMSRSNLEKIIEQFKLFQDQKDTYLEDQIKDLRSRISVKISHARHGSEAFSIKYKGNEPKRVKNITNTLASYFMDENLKVREAQAVGTSEFLDIELEKTRKKLEIREKKLAAYRAKNMGGLPDELESNLRTLDRFQKQLEGKQAILRDTKNNLTLLIDTRTKTKKKIKEENASIDRMNSQEQIDSSEDHMKLRLLEENLENLLLKYTNRHPDVLKTRNQIKKLTIKIGKTEKPEVKQEKSHDKTELDFLARKTELESEIQRISREIKAIEKKMEIYQTRVEQTPRKEQELQSLKRDYKNIQSIYTSLLDRKLEAEISVNMEKKQKGEQFKILDHARVPEKPVSPNVKKIFVIYFAAGTILSGGISFFLFLFDGKIRRNEEIEKEMGTPILAEIAPLKEKKDHIKEKAAIASFILISFYTLAVIGCFLVLNVQGIDRTIDLVKTYI